MNTTADIISDADIEKVHANANFGDMAKRDVVDDGVLQFVFGYDTGHTQMTILREHGLLRASRPNSYRADLSAKGKDYLRAMFRGTDYKKLLSVRSSQSAHELEVAIATVKKYLPPYDCKRLQHMIDSQPMSAA